MAGSGESAEEMGDFNQIRQTYINNIIEGLREAVSLMATLNSNLEVWGERTGELDKLGLVWGAFQNRMTSLSDALTSLDPPGRGTVNAARRALTTGQGDSRTTPRPSTALGGRTQDLSHMYID